MGFLKKLEGHFSRAKSRCQPTTLRPIRRPRRQLWTELFTITPHEDIQADEIRCRELKCTETAQVMKTEYDPTLKRMVTRQVTENRVLYQVKPPCNPATHLANGVTNTFKFSISIPAGSRPTFMSASDTIQWEIKGVIAVHGRPDVTTKEIQFQVIPQSQRPANEPPKVRLVACTYCQTEMPETTLTCPNCGARRTAQ